jgi:3-oxoacyl-[acyl-carrier protein] reductase
LDLGLTGRTALVMGGSQGLGLGVARALLAEGARVAISSRSPDGLAAARDALPAGLKDRCHTVAADLADPEAPAAIVDGARAALGSVDILVNNSGGPPTGMPSTVSADEMAAQFDKMVKPLIAITLALLPAMRERHWGRILTIASSGVVQPIPHLPVSNSLRASLVGFMKTLAGEVAADGITVNVLAPGRIATDRTRSIDAAVAKRTGRSEDDVARDSAGTIPAGRYGTVEEFGAVAAFLASAPASYVTGSIVRVDGGAIRSI